ncbi:MAG: hypothetical protein HY823_01370 [Acidobacteria bacterium]|nr:hypothetical protein [Acidobacteriota bacterium]
MLLPLYLGILHAVEPDHVAVVTGVSLGEARRGAWKVGLAFGLSHMLAVAIIAALAVFLGQAFFGERAFVWLDRCAWAFVCLLGLWNLSAAFGWRRTTLHAHAHHHGALAHEHPHAHGQPESHRFHHAAAWLGAFFGLGGVRGFTTLLNQVGIHGVWPFLGALLAFGAGITGMFILLSAASGWLAARLGTTERFRRVLYAVSGTGNLAIGIWLLLRP